MKNIIPIFPLNLVMFPDSLYPLHIFEERYKRMINRCVENDEFFGIISKIEFDISKIGCLAKVSRILNTFESGSMDIIVKGYGRFMTENTELHRDGYLEAEIVLFEDNVFQNEYESVYNRTIEVFKQIIDRTSLKLSEGFWENLEVAELKSYKLAEKSGLNLKQQQDILSMQSEKQRLDYLHKHLEKLEYTLEKSEALREIISADGYLTEI